MKLKRIYDRVYQVNKPFPRVYYSTPFFFQCTGYAYKKWERKGENNELCEDNEENREEKRKKAHTQPIPHADILGYYIFYIILVVVITKTNDIIISFTSGCCISTYIHVH